MFHFTCLLKQNSFPVVRCIQHFKMVSAAWSSGGIDEKYNSFQEPATTSYADNLIPVHIATSCFLNIQFAIFLSFCLCLSVCLSFPLECFFTVEIFYLDCRKLVIFPVHSLYCTQPITGISVITLIIQGNDITWYLTSLFIQCFAWQQVVQQSLQFQFALSQSPHL